jgi:hypothetical protein
MSSCNFVKAGCTWPEVQLATAAAAAAGISAAAATLSGCVIALAALAVLVVGHGWRSSCSYEAGVRETQVLWGQLWALALFMICL